jgi:hypothetical protein
MEDYADSMSIFLIPPFHGPTGDKIAHEIAMYCL